jgi:hypothetical protein
VEGCDGKHHAHGYCRRHYNQWYYTQCKAKEGSEDTARQEKFSVGDRVCWESHGGRPKEGVVVAVVPAYTPLGRFQEFLKDYDTRSCFREGVPRVYDSYLVAIDDGSGEKSKIYFPIVSQLERVKP